MIWISTLQKSVHSHFLHPFTGSLYWNHQPSWSPERKSIVFASSQNTHPTLNIYVMNADGAGLKQLTFSSCGWGNAFPSFSPDGSKIAFISDRHGNRSLFIMDEDGANLTKLTEEGQVGNYTVFSPDGTEIYFELRMNDAWDIYSIRLNDGQLTRITFHSWTDGGPVGHAQYAIPLTSVH